MSGPLLKLINGIAEQDWYTAIIYFFVIVVILLLAFPFHELGHAVVADRLGDDTPRNAGRITLNPIKHLDLLGTALFLLAGFGWATTPINPYNLRRVGGSWRNAWALVALAGPVCNLILAVVFAILFRVVYAMNEAEPALVTGMVAHFCANAVSINVLLMIFNLLPIPPLDGFTILSAFVPSQFENFMLMLRQYGMWILIFLSISRVLGPLVFTPANAITSLLLGV
jgi:Zn-dependent protease